MHPTWHTRAGASCLLRPARPASLPRHPFGKNIVVSLLTVVGIAIILFLVMIFFSLTGRMVDLITNIVNEITFRM